MVLLGLDGLVLLAVLERDGELEQAVESTAAAVCASCGLRCARTRAGRCGCGTCPPAGSGDPGVVKRVWRWHEPTCAKRTWTESHPAVGSRSSWTERARIEACRRG